MLIPKREEQAIGLHRDTFYPWVERSDVFERAIRKVGPDTSRLVVLVRGRVQRLAVPSWVQGSSRTSVPSSSRRSGALPDGSAEIFSPEIMRFILVPT
jgi:hypothetical protein